MKATSMSTTIGLTIFLLLCALSAWGFVDSDLDLKVRFDRIYGLQAGDPVWFEENRIGKVTSVSYERDGSYMVEMSIKSNFVNAATTFSEFFIVNDPQQQKNRAIEIVQSEPGGSVLEEGAVVKGTTSHALVLKRLTKDMEKGLDYLKGELEVLKEDIENIPETEEYRELKRELEEMVKDLRRACEESQKKIQEVFLPLLLRRLEALKEKLKEQQKKSPPVISPESV